jgi:Transglycosylase-like domain
MNAYGAPMPQAVPMPQGTPIPGAPPPGSYGPPSPMAAPPMAAPPAMASAAPASPYGAPAAPAAPAGIGQNGFGIHPDLNLDHVTAFLMNALKTHESAGNYDAKNPHSTASGGYQVTNGTWNNFGGYPRAVDAPPQVQDAWAKQNISQNLKRYGGDPFKATVAHYYPAWAGSPEKWDSVPIDRMGKPIPGAETPAQYASKVLPPEHVEKYLAPIRGTTGA